MDFLSKNAGVIAAAALLVGLVVLIMASVALGKAGKVQNEFDSAVAGVQPDVNAAVMNALQGPVTFGGQVVVQGPLVANDSASFAKGVKVTGDCTVKGDLTATGSVVAKDVTGTRNVTGQQGLLGKDLLVVDGNVQFGKNLGVGGTTTTGNLVNKAAK